MKHIRGVTVQRADAFSDFLASVQRAWADFAFAKRNESGGPGGGEFFG